MRIKPSDTNNPEKAIPIVKLDISIGFIFFIYQYIDNYPNTYPRPINTVPNKENINDF